MIKSNKHFLNGIISLMYVYLNNRLVQRAEAVVSVFDHGFLYGDGVYETMRAYDGVIFMLDEHLMRLHRSAALTGIAIPVDINQIKDSVYDTMGANSLKNAYVRLTVSRGYGPIGLDPDLCEAPTFVVIAEEMKEYPKKYYELGISAIIPRTRRNLKDAVDPQIKSLNFLNNILAKIEAKKAGSYEAIMVNAAGHLTEGTISNVFFCRGGVLCTPAIECGILDGITRNIVLDLAKREGLSVKEGEFTQDELYGAEEVFATNTTMEVMPVSQIDAVRYGAGKVARLLHTVYRGEVRAYVRNVKGSGPSLWGYE
jgi:branched-chain amino acid aminotransferase